MHTKLSSAEVNYEGNCCKGSITLVWSGERHARPLVPGDLEVLVGMMNKWDQKQKRAAEMD